MTTYRALVGKKIKKVTSDPSDSLDGQMWYNSTTGTLRGLAITEAWASSGPLLEANYGAGGAGSQTAMIYFGGSPYPARTNKTVEYNGTGWNTGGDYTGTVNYLSGCGTLTAGLGAGGFTGTANTTASAEYNGTSWTAGNSMSQQRMNTGSTMVGTQPAALITGGDQYPSTPRSLSTCEEYDGTNWTSGGAYPIVIQNTAQAGTQTAGWAAGGLSDPAPGVSNIARDVVNHYDGSSWSAGTALPTATFRAGASGTQTAGLFFAGKAGPYPSPPGNVTTTFAYDGSTWTAKPSLATARQSIAAGGVSSPSTAAIGAGGYTSPGVTAATEEFTASTNIITAAAWSAGGNLNTARYQHAGAGSTPAGLVFGGRKETAPSANYNNSEEYDGTSWTEGNNLNTARFGLYGIGTQTAGLACGGRTTPAVVDNSEEYDGTSYTEGNNLASARHGGASAGTQTAGLIFNGTNVTAPAPANMTTTSQSYDGTSWTATNSCNTARVVPYGFGTQTAAISVGGNPFSNSGESFDGTNWTAISGTLNDGRQQGFSSGTSTNGLVCGGNSPPNTTNVEAYNGTIFTTSPSLSTARRSIAGTPGTSVPTGVFGAGGYTSTELNSTEEFTPESIAGNVETFSTS